MTDQLKPAATKAKATKTRKPSVRTDFGKFCSKARIDLNIDSTQWAKDLGLSAITVNNLEFGRKELTVEVLVKVAEYLAAKGQNISELNTQFAMPRGILLFGALTDQQLQIVLATVEGRVTASVAQPAE